MLKAKGKIKGGKTKFPVRLSDGSVALRLGLLANADFSGLLIRRDVLDRLGFSPGQWIEVQCTRQGTKITRMMRCSHCENYTRIRGDYLYMDPSSAQCLSVDVDEIVRVNCAEYTFDIP
jgi:hypothetical protein